MRRLAFLVLVVLASACGGGESGELSRTEYTKRANASCMKAETTLAGLGGFADFKELERELKVGRDAMKQSAQELRELQPPPKLLVNHNKLISLTEETAELADRMSVAAGKNDQVEMQKQAERADKLTVAANDVSRRLGLLECVAG
jgi:hypothetical protein